MIAELPTVLSGISIDASIVMPNHLHVTIVIHGGEDAPGTPSRLILGEVVKRFKTLTTLRYIRGVTDDHWPHFDRRLWQRNYYEHIVRDDEALYSIREYIANPANWLQDPANPDRRDLARGGQARRPAPTARDRNDPHRPQLA